MEIKLNLERLEKYMRKYTEEHDDETEREMESAGLEAIVDVLKEQQETQREALELFKSLGMALIETQKELRILEIERAKLRDKQTAKLEKAKHKLEERKYNDSRLGSSTSETAHISESTKDLSKLPKAALAAKSGKSTKPKAKVGGGTRKKTT